MAIPNTTPTPNELYNGEMRKMSDTELRVVLMVTRATFGWVINKKTGMRKIEDWISHTELIKKTGKSSRAISYAIDSCVKKGWIETRDKVGNLLKTAKSRKLLGQKIFYRLGRIFLERTTTIANNAKLPSQPLRSTIANDDKKPSQPLRTTKERITKEIIPKKLLPKGIKGKPNLLINEILSYLKSKAGWVDGSQKQQRWGCKTFMSRVGKLIKEMGGEINDQNIIDGCKRIIDLAAKDKFHSQNFGKIKYLYDNIGTIVRSSQNKQRKIII